MLVWETRVDRVKYPDGENDGSTMIAHLNKVGLEGWQPWHMIDHPVHNVAYVWLKRSA